MQIDHLFSAATLGKVDVGAEENQHHHTFF
jgi:hypothetical protein